MNTIMAQAMTHHTTCACPHTWVKCSCPDKFIPGISLGSLGRLVMLEADSLEQFFTFLLNRFSEADLTFPRLFPLHFMLSYEIAGVLSVIGYSDRL